jgi:hypothetical protein
MSAFSASDRRGVPTRTRAGAALAALVLVLGVGTLPADARTRARGDSGDVVNRIEISPRGIVIDRADGRRRVADVVIGDDTIRVHGRLRTRGSDLVEFDHDGTGIVRIFSDAAVPAGERVDGDVVAVFGSVDIAGEVTGDVVAVFGSLTARDSAHIHGDAVSVGGGLDQRDAAVIDGESVALGFLPFTWGLPALPVMLVSIAAGWAVSMFVGWIFVLLFPTSVLRVATVVERRPAASFFLGLLSVPLFFLLLALLFVTVVGIPLGILLPMLYVMVGYAGQLAATCVLGARISRRSLPAGLMAPLAVGTLFVAAILTAGAVMAVSGGLGHPLALLFTLTGCLLLLGLGALGTGAFLLSRFGTRPAEVTWPGHTATGQVPAPAPTTIAP